MMADEIASLILKVESSGITKAASALDNLTKSGMRAEDAAGSLSDGWGAWQKRTDRNRIRAFCHSITG